MALDKLTKVQSVGISSFIQVVGVVTATGGFVGDGSGLTGITASSATGDFSIVDKIVHTGDTNTAIRFPAADTFTVETAGSERLRITSAGIVRIPDNGKFTCGASDDLQIYHDGSNSVIKDNGTGKLILDTDGAAIEFQKQGLETIATFNSDGAVELYHDNSKKFETTSYGAQFTDNVKFDNPDTAGRDLTWEADNDALHWEDNTKATFGAGNDLQIYHNGTHSYIADEGSGELNISGSRIQLMNAARSEKAIDFVQDGAVDIYYDGSKRFETTSAGVKISNNLYLGGSTNGGFSYNPVADTLEFLTTNGSTHSELTSNAYVPSASGTRHLGYANKRWDTLYVDKIAFGGSANTSQHSLDDYEEGTWSPNVGGNASYDIQWGYYVKVGSLVHCWGGLRTQTLGTGNARVINNLPFTAVASPGSTQTGGGSVVWHDNAPNNIINTPAIAVTPNTTNSFINAKTSGSGLLQDTVDFWQNNHRANFFITYYTTV